MHYSYILANRPKGTLYIGHTDDLRARYKAHLAGTVKGLTSKHRECKQIMWFETHETTDGAYKRVQQMRGWTRSQVIKRLRVLNPKWTDLSGSLTDAHLSSPERAYSSGNTIET